MSRRRFLGGAVAAGAAVTGRGARAAPAQEGPVTFTHGVASGDPLADRVILWTRAVALDGAPVDLRWLVATDPDLVHVVAEGTANSDAETDWTARVDAAGLAPGTIHFYRFEAGSTASPVGRTRTARGPGDAGEVRLGVVSCASYVAGHFAAYARLTERDPDLVVHLGDYLYETSSGASVRTHQPAADPVTLEEYRARHAQQRSDPALLELHRRVPVAATWDDHEVAGNAWRDGAEAHDPSRQGPWGERRAAAMRAWLEWLPVRLPDPDDPERIWRSLPLGGVADLVLVDTRHDDRDEPVGADHPDADAAVADPDRRMLSDAQRAWLADELRGSTAAWRVVASQVVVSPLAVAVPEPLAAAGRQLGVAVGGRIVNADQWDGYEAERERFVGLLAEDAVADTIVLAGDLHSSWAFELPGPGGEGADPVAVELVTPSITAPSFARLLGVDAAPVAGAVAAALFGQLPHLRWAELRSHGYLELGITTDGAQADWWHVTDVDEPDAEEVHAASWAVERGTPALVEADGAMGARAEEVPEAPPPVGTATSVPPTDGGGAGPWKFGLVGTAAVAALAVAVRMRRRGSD